jgi:hypothetical protein
MGWITIFICLRTQENISTGGAAPTQAAKTTCSRLLNEYQQM